MKIPAIGLLLALLVVPVASAKRPDVRSRSAAVPPTVNSSENTPINYLGGTPSPVLVSLDQDDSTYNRVVDCGNLSTSTAVAYDTITIVNASGSVAAFTAWSSPVGGGTCGETTDTFLTLYDTTFNPASPTSGCLAANDDIDSGTELCSLLTFSIPIGATRVIVATSFEDAANGGLFDCQVNFTASTPVELQRFDAE